MPRSRTAILRDLNKLLHEVEQLRDRPLTRKVKTLAQSVEHMRVTDRDVLPDSELHDRMMENARKMGEVEAMRRHLRAGAMHDPELCEALRARAWLEHGLPSEAQVRSDGAGWLVGLPNGWPPGFDADDYIEHELAPLFE